MYLKWLKRFFSFQLDFKISTPSATAKKHADRNSFHFYVSPLFSMSLCISFFRASKQGQGYISDLESGLQFEAKGSLGLRDNVLT